MVSATAAGASTHAASAETVQLNEEAHQAADVKDGKLRQNVRFVVAEPGPVKRRISAIAAIKRLNPRPMASSSEAAAGIGDECGRAIPGCAGG